jgi:hypothetical protein
MTTYKREQVRLALDRLDMAIKEGKSADAVLQLAQDAADTGASLPCVNGCLPGIDRGLCSPHSAIGRGVTARGRVLAGRSQRLGIGRKPTGSQTFEAELSHSRQRTKMG